MRYRKTGKSKKNPQPVQRRHYMTAEEEDRVWRAIREAEPDGFLSSEELAAFLRSDS